MDGTTVGKVALESFDFQTQVIDTKHTRSTIKTHLSVHDGSHYLLLRRWAIISVVQSD